MSQTFTVTPELRAELDIYKSIKEVRDLSPVRQIVADLWWQTRDKKWQFRKHQYGSFEHLWYIYRGEEERPFWDEGFFSVEHALSVVELWVSVTYKKSLRYNPDIYSRCCPYRHTLFL